MSQHYDAVIVGGGVAGALVARVLSQAGKRVLILEAGIEGAMSPETYRRYLQTLYTEGGVRGMPNGPYPWNEAAPSPGIPGRESYYQYDTPMHFMSDYLRMLGGTTLHWQGTSLRLVPSDFRMQSTYGHGIDWPIGYDDLEPAYRRVEEELGVSADVEDQRFFGVWFPEGYVYPMHRMPQSRVDQFFDRKLAGKSVTLHGRRYPL
ncbi:MAG: NAD(P)-binding protein, partial [Gemmatimonadales bacterium]